MNLSTGAMTGRFFELETPLEPDTALLQSALSMAFSEKNFVGQAANRGWCCSERRWEGS